MGKTSKSPKAVLLTAHRVGQNSLRAYSHLFSPKKFTQPQLFACLVLKEFMRLDYRKLTALLKGACEYHSKSETVQELFEIRVALIDQCVSDL